MHKKNYGIIGGGKGASKTDNAGKLAIHRGPEFTLQDFYVLGYLLKEVYRQGIIVTEVGSFLGNGSTKAILQAVLKYKSAEDSLIYCVDTWEGNNNVELYSELKREYNLFETFLYNVNSLGGKNIVKPMVMRSEDAAEIFKDKSCDFVFIDADHTYNCVKKDIKIWKTKVKPGGILCGHDCEGSLADFNIEIINKNLYKDFVHLENFIFEGFHPGVVKAVGEEFGNSVTLWSHKDLAEHGISGRSSIWSISL